VKTFCTILLLGCLIFLGGSFRGCVALDQLVIDRVIRLALLCLSAWSLAVALSRPALALPDAFPTDQCQLTPAASDLLRKFYEARPSKVVRLLTAINIFSCEVQNRYLEALGMESGSSDSGAILDLAAATGKRRETVCIKQMNRSQRLELSALSRREMAVFMLRIPCFEQRRILTKCAKQESDKSCERNAWRQLFSDWRESLRLSLEEAILSESEDLPVDRAFDD
jgi:hypothetical protein